MIIERSGTGGGLGLTVNLYELINLRTRTPGVSGGSGGEGTTTDDKVRISATDTTNDFANPKFVEGSRITKTILNPGGNEQLEFQADNIFIHKDLDAPDTNTLDLLEFDYYTKLTTVIADQDFLIENEKLTYFKLELTGGTLDSTLFTHATKSVSTVWDAGVLEQYAPLLNNTLRFEVKAITPDIILSGTLVNSDNQIDTTETPVQVKTASFTAVGGIPYRIEGAVAVTVTVPIAAGDRLGIVNASSEIAIIGALGNLAVGGQIVLYYDGTWKEYTNILT